MRTSGENAHATEFTVLSEQTTTRSTKRTPIEYLTLLLRTLGALIVLSSAAVYLFPHWQKGDDVERYMMLLGVTLVLSVAGFFCSLKLKENKGARTLLGLSLGVMPVHFAVLGGFLYSQFSTVGLLNLPQYATWIAPSPTSALALTGGALFLLTPIAYLAFMVMARNHAGQLTGLFLLVNAVLLIPMRTADPVALLSIGLVLILLEGDRRWFHQNSQMKTLEGIYSRALLVVPLGILIGRSLAHYPVTDFLIGTLLGLIALVLFVGVPRLVDNGDWAVLAQGTAVVPAALSWLVLSVEIGGAVNLPDYLALPWMAWPYAALLVLMSVSARSHGRSYRVLAAVVVLAAGLTNLMIFGGVGVALTLVFSGIMILVYGFSVEQQALFFSGVLSVFIGTGYTLWEAVRLFSFNHWAYTALLGIAIILGASLLERQHGTLMQRVGHLRRRVKSWDF